MSLVLDLCISSINLNETSLLIDSFQLQMFMLGTTTMLQLSQPDAACRINIELVEQGILAIIYSLPFINLGRVL